MAGSILTYFFINRGSSGTSKKSGAANPNSLEPGLLSCSRGPGVLMRFYLLISSGLRMHGDMFRFGVLEAVREIKCGCAKSIACWLKTTPDLLIAKSQFGWK